MQDADAGRHPGEPERLLRTRGWNHPLRFSIARDPTILYSMETPTSSAVCSDSASPAAASESPPAKRSIEEIKAYQHVKRVCHLSGLGIAALYWLIWLAMAGGFVNWVDLHFDSRWAALGIAALFMYGGSTLVHLPLDYYSSYIVEHRFKLSNQTPGTGSCSSSRAGSSAASSPPSCSAGCTRRCGMPGSLWGVWVWIGVMALQRRAGQGVPADHPAAVLPVQAAGPPVARPNASARWLPKRA